MAAEYAIAQLRRLSGRSADRCRPERSTASPACRAKLLVEPEALAGFRALLTYNYADSLGPQTEQIAIPPPGSEAREYPDFEPVSFASETHTINA